MDDFTYAVLDGEFLLKGSLRLPIPAQAWIEDRWFALRTSLCALDEHEALRMISDEEAGVFLNHARARAS